MPKPPAHRCRRRPPFFHPVPLRARDDGWSAERQCGFLAQLYVTGSVGAAARSVGMARTSAYRLRQRAGAESFAHAWNTVLLAPGAGHCRPARRDWRKVTDQELAQRVETGLLRPVLYRGAMVGIRRKSDHSALLRLMRRFDARLPRTAANGLER